MRADRLRLRTRGLRVAAALAAMAVLGVLTFGPAQQAQATNYVAIVGTGSTYAYPALNQWATDLQGQNLSITYTPTGSATGRLDYIDDTVDYAGTDIAFLFKGDADPFNGTDIDHASFAYSYIPDVAGGLSFLYNIQVDGHQIRNMRLSGQTIAEIFTGHITNWDDPAITRDYGRQLPSIPITVVTRSDGAGESYFLTRWMLHEYPGLWVNYCKSLGGGPLCSVNPTELYPAAPGFKSLNGSDEVAGYINSSVNNGAIGYAEYAYAIPNNIPVVSVLNKAGYYQQPTAANVAVALHAAIINRDQNSVTFLMQNLDPVYTDSDPRTYPLSSYSYLLVPRNSRTIGGITYHAQPKFSTGQGATLSKYVGYILCQAQYSAQSLGYSPLPDVMVQGGFHQYGYIPGALPDPEANNNNYSSCNNPAYKDGVDTILASAPYPNKCQKQGSPLNCNPNAPGSGAVNNGPGGPGSGNNGPGGPGGNGKNNGSGGVAAGPGSGTKIDPNTGQVIGGTSSANADVYAQPVGVAGRPAEQWLFGLLTALELAAVVVVPVALGTWLQRRKRASAATRVPGGVIQGEGER